MSSSQNEITEVKNPCKVKVRRGLAKARKSVDENIDVSTAGVYTLELDKFHQETKPNIEIHVNDIIKETALAEVQKETKPTTTTASECEKEFEIDCCLSPQSESLHVDSPSLYAGELGQLLKDIENTQVEFLQRNVLNVLSDSDECCVIDSEQESGSDIIDIDNEPPRNMIIRVLQKHRITRHSLSTKESFSKLIEELAVQNEVQPSQILLSLNGNSIRSNDTPESVGLEIADILDLSIGQKLEDVTKSDNSGNKLRLKVQSKDFRSKIDIVINKDDPMSRLMEEYARRTSANLSDLIFKFDGDEIQPDNTVTDLDLEEDYCIDVIVKNRS